MLMKRCNEDKKKKCREMINREERCNVKHRGVVVPIVNNKLVNKT